MTARLLIDLENLPSHLQEAVAQFASPLNGSDLRHLVSIADSDDEEEMQERYEEIVRKAEQHDEWRARMQRAITGEEPLRTLGSYRRPQRRAVDPEPWLNWFREDATRVGLVAAESVRLGSTVDAAIDGAFETTRRLDLDPDTAERAILAALMETA